MGMSTPPVQLSDASHRILQELAEQTGQSASEVLDKALDAYRRKLFFDELNAGYAALRADPKAWAELEAERKLWDATLMDGLDPDERWTEDGRCLTPEQEEG
jgi:predicted transcriptional regulator